MKHGPPPASQDVGGIPWKGSPGQLLLTIMAMSAHT